MKKIFLILIIIATSVTLGNAQSPTWADDVASVIYANCSNCHHEGGIGPFSLMTYQDAVDNTYGIQAQVEAKLMPPWKPDPNYVHFTDERILSESDIALLSSWVNAGAPSGDLNQAPPAPVFQTGSQLPVVDLSLQAPSYTVMGEVDEYRTFVIHSDFTEDVFLNQIEYLAGNGSIVHHFVLFYDPTNYSWNLDEDDTIPGYESYGLGPINIASQIIGAWAPGSAIFELPPDMGIRIPAGADFGIEVHYSPGSAGLTDNSTVNLKYTAAQPNIREVYVDGLLNHFDNLTDGPLFIPANTVKTFHELFEWEYGDISVLSIFPHMHLVGKSFKVWALNENNDTTKLINIPNWDFHWQGFYLYQKPIHITDPSEFWAEATYDNTTNNPDNPNNPPLDVEAGEHTTDEMMIAFLTYLPYEPGDENIVLDSTLISGIHDAASLSSEINVFPNPASDHLNIYLDAEHSGAVQFSLYDQAGAQVMKWNRTATGNPQTISASVKNLAPGIYLLKMTSAEGNAVEKVAKVVKQ